MTNHNLEPWPLARIPKSEDDVWEATYPDFVAMINQTNVMPGAFATLNTWAINSRIGRDSRVLEVACTTGFSSRELARMTDCAAVGFDISDDSVRVARYNARTSAPDLDLEYLQADGETFGADRKFTHVVVGAALGFFPDPQAMATRVVSMLQDTGYVLASPFWSDTPLPERAQQVRREVFGIESPLETRSEAFARFRGLDVMYCSDHSAIPESNDEVIRYCEATVERACRQAGLDDVRIRQAMFDRLYQVRQASNELRAYLNYSVLVLRYNNATYPNRYVELF